MSSAPTLTSAEWGIGETKAARFLEREQEIEEQADRTTDELRRKWAAHQERLRKDPDLTTEAVQRRADELYEPLKERMTEARSTYGQKRETLLSEVRAACFGKAPTDGAKLQAWRDAQDRAEAITDKQVADRVVRRALESGDEGLALAVARVAHDRGWGDPVATRAVPLPLLEALGRLERPPDRRHGVREMYRWTLSR